jgi:hypothetical protein
MMVLTILYEEMLKDGVIQEITEKFARVSPIGHIYYLQVCVLYKNLASRLMLH